MSTNTMPGTVVRIKHFSVENKAFPPEVIRACAERHLMAITVCDVLGGQTSWSDEAWDHWENVFTSFSLSDLLSLVKPMRRDDVLCLVKEHLITCVWRELSMDLHREDQLKHRFDKSTTWENWPKLFSCELELV